MLSEATLRLQPAERDRDMRSKRPPAVSFLLRMETVRRVARVLSLLALDLVGVALAIFTALASKEVVVTASCTRRAPLKGCATSWPSPTC